MSDVLAVLHHIDIQNVRRFDVMKYIANLGSPKGAFLTIRYEAVQLVEGCCCLWLLWVKSTVREGESLATLQTGLVRTRPQTVVNDFQYWLKNWLSAIASKS